jgi:hypothetical protein
MIKKQFLAGAVLLSTCMNAIAVEWDLVIKKTDYEILVDIDSYDVAEGYPYILTKTIFKNPLPYTSHKKLVNYQYQLKNTQFNCKQAMYKVTSIDYYNNKNKLLISEKPAIAFMPITSGSDEFSVGQLVCQVYKMVGGQ